MKTNWKRQSLAKGTNAKKKYNCAIFGNYYQIGFVPPFEGAKVAHANPESMGCIGDCTGFSPLVGWVRCFNRARNIKCFRNKMLMKKNQKQFCFLKNSSTECFLQLQS